MHSSMHSELLSRRHLLPAYYVLGRHCVRGNGAVPGKGLGQVFLPVLQGSSSKKLYLVCFRGEVPKFH